MCNSKSDTIKASHRMRRIWLRHGQGKQDACWAASTINLCRSKVPEPVLVQSESKCDTAVSWHRQSWPHWGDLCPHQPTIAGVTSYGRRRRRRGASGGSNYHHTRQIWLYKQIWAVSRIAEMLIHTDGLSDHADTSFSSNKTPRCGRGVRLDLTNWKTPHLGRGPILVWYPWPPGF